MLEGSCAQAQGALCSRAQCARRSLGSLWEEQAFRLNDGAFSRRPRPNALNGPRRASRRRPVFAQMPTSDGGTTKLQWLSPWLLSATPEASKLGEARGAWREDRPPGRCTEDRDCPKRPIFGLARSKFGRVRSKLDRSQPNLVEVLQLWLTSAQICRHGRSCSESGQLRPNFGRTRPTCGRDRPNLVDFGQTWAELGSTRSRSGAALE